MWGAFLGARLFVRLQYIGQKVRAPSIQRRRRKCIAERECAVLEDVCGGLEGKPRNTRRESARSDTPAGVGLVFLQPDFILVASYIIKVSE